MAQPDPTILGIDSATSGCAVAVVKGGRVLASDGREMARGQAEVLMTMVDGVLKEANVSPSQLDAIATTIGPGSFTGLRIGMAAARGLSLSLSIPCIGVTTFEALSLGVETDGNNFIVAVETKRDDIYAQLFDASHKPLSEGAALDEVGLKALADKAGDEVLIAGDGAAHAIQMLKNVGINSTALNATAIPAAEHICNLAAEKFIPGEMGNPPQPLYLRPPEAKLPKAGGRARP